jgi:kumamolisin
VEDSVNQERVALPGSRRSAKAGAARIGDSSPDEQIELTVTVRGPDLPGADTVGGPPIEIEELAALYGSSSEEIGTIKTELCGRGFIVTDMPQHTRSLLARGTSAQIRDTFGVELGIYRNTDQTTFRGREGVIEIPKSLEGIVTGVFGLDDRRVARRGTPPIVAQSPLTPIELESRYDFPEGEATGQIIAIAEFGGGYFPEDVKAFCGKYDRPVPTVRTVPVGLKPLSLEAIKRLPQAERVNAINDSNEVMMDVEIVASLCSAARVLVYFAPSTQKGWIDLISKVISSATDLPIVLSISWGLAEDSPDWSISAVDEINQRLQIAAMLGVTVCAAAGDDGSGDQISDGRAHVNFPASSPFVLSVGGTMFDVDSGREVVWWEAPGDRAGGGGSTGGGVSTIFKRPSWQAVKINSLNSGSIDGRVVPDVAALAGWPFYELLFLGSDSPNGGTSAATPLWASLLARMFAADRRLRPRQFVTPLIYNKQGSDASPSPGGFNDITSGDNMSSPSPGKGYEAGHGYDAVTGWGTPRGKDLLSQL